MITSSRMNGLNPYVPGEQPKDREYVKINANENPYPPSPYVISSVLEFISKHPEKLGVYPDPDSLKLHSAIADMLNKTGGVLSRCKTFAEADGSVRVEPAEEDKIPFTVTPDMVYTGNGSDEVLSFVFYAFFDSSKSFVMPKFTYSFYPVYAGFYNIPSDAVPLKEDWSIDMQKMLDISKKNNSGIIFANPNAPTSLAVSREEVREMLLKANKDEIFIVDEAYVDFGGESCIPLLQEFDNLLIVRTFSKSLCGAGQRLGYIVANPKLINIVTTVKNSVNHFPLDSISQVSGVAACESVDYYINCAKKVCEVREDFYNFLSEKRFFVLKSKTNFLFVSHPKISGEEFYQRIKKEGILIRHFNVQGIENFVRITVGTKDQMELLKKAIEKVLGEI